MFFPNISTNKSYGSEISLGARLFIGDELYYKLSEVEQSKYEAFRRNKPDWIGECIDNYPDRDFSDELFRYGTSGRIGESWNFGQKGR